MAHTTSADWAVKHKLHTIHATIYLPGFYSEAADLARLTMYGRSTTKRGHLWAFSHEVSGRDRNATASEMSHALSSTAGEVLLWRPRSQEGFERAVQGGYFGLEQPELF